MPVLISLAVYVFLVMLIISSGSLSLFSHSNVLSEVVLFERIQYKEQRHKFRVGKICLLFKILRAAFIRSKIK